MIVKTTSPGWKPMPWGYLFEMAGVKAAVRYRGGEWTYTIGGHTRGAAFDFADDARQACERDLVAQLRAALDVLAPADL